MRLTDIVPPPRLPGWLDALSILNVFWTKKPLTASWDPEARCLTAAVRYRRRAASYTLCEEQSTRALEAELPHIAVPEDAEPPPHRSVSLLYFWRPPGSPLSGAGVAVEVAEEPGRVAELAGEACRVQRRSWGLCLPPRPGVHTVFIARIGGEPVGAAYYNRRSYNVDWGVHVARGFWRRRIGSRLLAEVLGYAARRGDPWVSVVRVLGSRRPRPGDARAAAFYRANGPLARLRVYRLARKRFTGGGVDSMC